MGGRPNTVARILAPSALVAAFLAFVIVVSGSGGDGGSAGAGGAGDGSGKRAKAEGDRAPANRTRQQPTDRKTYVVKSGDNLSTIAEQTGVDVDRLTELNPDTDPQALISGQCIALVNPSDCD